MALARRLLHALIVVLALLAGATLAVVTVSQTAWFKNWLRGYVVRQASQYINGRLDIDRLEGDLFHGVAFERVTIAMDGTDVVSADEISARYSLLQLLTQGLTIDEVRVVKPRVRLRREGEAWNVANVIKDQPDDPEAQDAGSPLAIDVIRIEGGSVVVDPAVGPETPLDEGLDGVRIPARIEDVDAELSFASEPPRYTMAIDHVSFKTVDPALTLMTFTGQLAVSDDTLELDEIAIHTGESALSIDGAITSYLSVPRFALSVVADRLSVPELARLVPSLEGVTLAPSFDLSLHGPIDGLRTTLDLRSAAGDLHARLVTDLQNPGQAIEGDVSISHIDLSKLQPGQPSSDVTATLAADLTAASLSDVGTIAGDLTVRARDLVFADYRLDTLDANATMSEGNANLSAAVRAYGGHLQAAGRVDLPVGSAPVTYDIGGTVRQIDLRRLPLDTSTPRPETDLNAGYRIHGTEPQAVGADRTLDAQVTFESSSVPGATIAPGSAMQATLRGSELSYAADATVRGVDLAAVGEAFEVTALQEDRFRSSLNLHVKAEGHGTELASLALDAEGELSDSEISGAVIPTLTFAGRVREDRAEVVAHARVDHANPADVSGDARLEGDVAGEIDASFTIAGLSTGVTADTVEGEAKLVLDRSTFGDLVVDRAAADLAYDDLVADVRTLEVRGRDFDVTAQGRLALNESDDSNLSVNVESSRLEELGALFDVPIEGIARIEATVSGNRRQLEAAGTATASALRYAGNGALSVKSQIAARIPGLDVSRASVEAETSATFVSLAGQEINTLEATTTYEARELGFGVTARQPERSLAASGALRLLPAQQELQLRTLALQSRDVELRLAEGSSASIQYGDRGLAVDDLRLTTGSGEIRVDGAFGRTGDTLTVSADDFDVALVDAVLLREPQLSGQLDLTAALSGDREAPSADVEYAVTEGRFRQFTYDALTGTLTYVPQGLTVDVRLQQNPVQWVTARGYVPTAVFRSGAVSDASEADRSADRIDLVVDSSPIDLGVVQGFTTALTEVAGTAEAHVRVTGTAERPEPSGSVVVRNGAFRVEPTGSEYRHVSASVDLQPDRIHIAELTILDNHDSALSLTGEVALDEARVRGVELYVTSDDFKVLDNELGNIRVQSSLGLTGELTAPRVGGYLGITSGELNVDNLLATVGTSPYQPVESADTEGEDAPTEAGAVPTGPYEAATVDVTVDVPNALVVRGDNLQLPDAPIGLGALTLTLGGDVRATKKPGDTLRLVGTVNTIRGEYDFQGRRFEILRDGGIRFVGLEDINPTLDLRTRRLIQGVEARVNIRGSLRSPQIELSSTPPLEPADILSLIVFNQPINQLGEGQQASLLSRAQALATGAVAGQLAQSIGNALNLDTFEIQVAPEFGGGPQVTLGQQVSDRLFLRVQQGIGVQSTTNLVLEYQVSDWLRLQTKIVQGASTQPSLFLRNQGSGADLLFFFSY